MIKILQFAVICINLVIFVVTFPIIILATNSFLSLQYALLPGSVDQKIKAQESLAALTSFNNYTTANNLFTSINQTKKTLPLYTPSEVDHLVDVKKRFDVVRLAAIVSLVVLLFQACTLKPREFTQFTYKACQLGLLMVSAAGVLLLISWNWLFTAFHELLFPAGNWSFPPNSGLIQLFPAIFWFRFGFSWISMVLCMLLTTTLISRIIINRTSSN